MKPLKTIFNEIQIDEALVPLYTLGQVLGFILGVGTFEMFYKELHGPFEIIDIIRCWWFDKKASQIVLKLKDITDKSNIKSQEKYKQNKLWSSILSGNLSEKDAEYLVSLTGNKLKILYK